MAERLFRILSIVFLTAGIIASLAGADKQGMDKSISNVKELIQEINEAETTNSYNSKGGNRGQVITLTSTTQSKTKISKPE